jgi:rhodanese-related sulfurtransferase
VIRDRLKRGLRRAALKAFGMEWDAEELPPNPSNSKVSGPFSVDQGVIPRVVDGSGDTPGPNHPEEIGRTWLASQVGSGVAGAIVDLRPPRECANGTLPGARVILPGQLASHLGRLPAKEVRITVYDQAGTPVAGQAAALLRREGWLLARALRGGFAEWLEHSEPIERPEPPPGGRFHLGMPVEILAGARRGVVQAAGSDADGPLYAILLDDGTCLEGLRDREIAG